MRSQISYGNGMYKSTDAGKSWTHIGLDNTRQIGRVLVDPQNPDVVFVAALGHVYGANPDRGVYRTRDGGATWQKVLFKSNDVGAIDLNFDPTHVANDLRLAVEHPPSAVEHLSAVVRAGQRALQVDRRRRELAAADARPADRRRRPHRCRGRAVQPQPRLRHRRREGGRPVSIRRCRRDVREGVGRRAHLGTRLVLRQGRRRSEERGPRLRVEHRRLPVARRRADVRRTVQGIAGRRRLPPALDFVRGLEPDDPRRRSGRGDQRRRAERSPDLELVAEPADRAGLPHRGRQRVSRTG